MRRRPAATAAARCSLLAAHHPPPRLAVPLQEKDLIRLKREAKAAKGFYVEPEAKLAFVIRIRGLNKIHPKVRQPPAAATTANNGFGQSEQRGEQRAGLHRAGGVCVQQR